MEADYFYASDKECYMADSRHGRERRADPESVSG